MEFERASTAAKRFPRRNGATMNGDGTWRGLSARIRTWMRLLRRGNRTPMIGPAGSGDPPQQAFGALLYLSRGGPADPLARRDGLDLDELGSLADLSEDD